MEMNKLIRHQIRVWLLNGVTYREVIERLGWLGIATTEKEVEEIAKGGNS